MKRKVPTRRMREHPDLEQLKRQAKELLGAYQAGEAAAIAEVNAHYHSADPAQFALHDAQLTLARSYGFDSWPKLKAYVDGVTIRRFVEAIGANDQTLVRAMLKARPEIANLTVSYGDEHRAIHFAVMNRLPEMTRLLMQHGADARAGIHPYRDATGARTMAWERGFDEIVAIIDEEENRRPAQPAVVLSEAEQVELGDEEARAAVASGDLEWLRARHAQGNFVNPIRDNGGLLTVAVRHNQPAALRLLLDFGFDPNERISWGEGDWVAYSQAFPLWAAAALGRREMAETLLQRGADPNAHVDSSGSSVYSAYSHKQWDMVELLRRHGGIVTADIAAIYRQTDLARRMLEEGQPVAQELLRHGAGAGATDIVRMALERIDLPRDDPRWMRYLTQPLDFWHHMPWLYAGNKDFDRASYLDCFRLILARCDPDVRAGFGYTALHTVAAMGDWITDDEVLSFARALLDAGAATNIRDNLLNSTALGWACRWGRAPVVSLLLERGVDPVETDAEPWARPVAWAQKMNHPAIVRRLQSDSAANP